MGCGKSTNSKAKDPGVPTQMVSRPGGPIILHYFNFYLRGEVIRMVLHHLSIPFTDDRINPPDWPRLKTSGKFEFQQLPVLEYEGKSLAQTQSILRYVCQRNNMYPARTNTRDVYCVESVCDWVNDFTGPTVQLLFMKDMQGLEAHYRDKAPNFLVLLEKRLNKNAGGKGFFVGSSCTMADIQVFAALWDHFCRPEIRARNESKLLPGLRAFVDRIMACSPGLKNYVNARASSPA